MHKFLVLLCFMILPFFAASGQNIRDYYVTNVQSDGTLYFIFPMALFEQPGNGELIMDITYKTKMDSATVNFTYNQKMVAEADSVSFNGPVERFCGVPQKLYIEAKKLPHWEHRYSLKLPFGQLSALFAAEAPFRIQIYSKGKILTYNPKRVGWTKQVKIVHTILSMAKM